MNTPFPIIKLTVDHMRQEILHAFSTGSHQYQEQLDNALKQTIEDFNFQAEVAQLANHQISATVAIVVKEVVQDLRFNIDFQILCRQALIDKLQLDQKADIVRQQNKTQK